MYMPYETEKPLAPEVKQAAVTVSKIGLDWLGKIITHKDAGQGIVVGYSPVTGEPCAYFYSGEYADRICYFSHKGVVSVAESSSKCDVNQIAEELVEGLKSCYCSLL